MFRRLISALWRDLRFRWGWLVALGFGFWSCQPAQSAVDCHTADLEAAYLARLAAECKGAELQECPAWPDLRAQHVRAVEDRCGS